MNTPSSATVKRLFAVSGNRCAFPKCLLHLVDAASGKVTGRIAHIKARQPAGPRYDEAQTDEQRHAFENLLLLCPIHHDVIDADSESYTVERLTKMKVDHEAAQVPQPEVGDSVARQFIANIQGNTVTHGSIIFSQNQMGGQVAHSIQNFGPQPRQVSPAAASALVAELQKYTPESIDLHCIMGDTEGCQLAALLKEVIERAGWQVNGVQHSIFKGPVKGVIIEAPLVRPSLETLRNWLGSAGLNPQAVHRPATQDIRLIVGANL